ncbi:Pentatricopeptide repeat-containing protein, partial [Glycine soja]
MCLKCDRIRDARKLFDIMPERDVVVWSAMVAGYSRLGLVDEAKEFFGEMRSGGMAPNLVSWNDMLAGFGNNGLDMQADGVEPNAVTIPSLIPACGNISALMHGKEIHCFSLRRGIFDDVYVGSALIDMYAKCGRIQLSRCCFDKMSAPNLVSWNAVMSGMRAKWPDRRRVALFNSMSEEHGFEPKREHYACMVTLLSRVGKLEEAYSIIKEMPFEPDACVWGALLSSCRVHNNLSLGEITAEKLFLLEPTNPGNYIILSNIYASKGLWDEENRIREVMKSKGLRKNPGYSWIEVGHKIHMLLAGDQSHPQMKDILEKLDKLNMEMKKSGYLPKSNFVWQDVEEHDKEQILCGHSEKLAVVLGLLNTSPGQPLQVIKNLRICDDCHAVIK